VHVSKNTRIQIRSIARIRGAAQNVLLDHFRNFFRTSKSQQNVDDKAHMPLQRNKNT
jgi:ABC-type thiamine transport system substrate-binding protein